MADSPIFVGSWRVQQTALLASHGTTLGLIGWAGGTGGSRVQGISAVNIDATTNDLFVYYAQRVTLQSSMGVGALVDGGGGSDTITRTVGSFVTDGWKIGDRLLVADPTTLANSFFTTLTAVAALTLTFATATVGTAENLPTGAALYRLTQLHRSQMAINAGNSSGTSALDGLLTDWPIADISPDRYITLAPNDSLAFSVGSVIGASPDRVELTVFGADY